MPAIILLFLALILPGCAALEPSMRDIAPPPVTLEGKTKPPAAMEEDQGLFAREEQDAAELDRLLARLDAGTRAFNQRMDAALASVPPRPARTPSAVTRLSDDLQEITFNFYDADLVEVIRLFMELLGDGHLLHPGVAGRVSLSVAGTFNRDQLLELLQGVLRIHGAAMLRSGEVWEILPLAEAPGHLGADRLILPGEGGAPQRGQFIQAFRLHFISAEEMTNVITPHLSAGAQVYADERLGLLLVSDFPHALRKVEELLSLFDVSVFADVAARVFTLRHVSAAEAAEQLQAVAEAFGLGPELGSPRARVSFLPMERGNQLLVLTRDAEIMEFLDIWVAEIDREVPEAVQAQHQENVFVYYVQYADAAEIVATLGGLFGATTGIARTAGGDEPARATTGLFPQGENPRSEQPEQAGGGPVRAAAENGTIFVVDAQNNAILTRSSSTEYERILAVIERLDLYPKQVLIEVVIAEVNLREGSELGVEWQALINPRLSTVQSLSVDSGLGAITDTASQITSGLSYVITSTRNFKAVLQASASRGNARILSTPTLLASNNKPAHINIGQDVPVPSSTRRRISDVSDTETLDTTIQYRKTGIVLEVTPRINNQGMVHMDISQEVSDLLDIPIRNIPPNTPVFSSRIATTTASVNDQQTIVIGGLIRQNRNDSHQGVPGVARVPLLKYLFGFEQRQFENTELMIFITPHVILNEPDSTFITREFQQRLDEIKAAFY